MGKLKKKKFVRRNQAYIKNTDSRKRQIRFFYEQGLQLLTEQHTGIIHKSGTYALELGVFGILATVMLNARVFNVNAVFIQRGVFLCAGLNELNNCETIVQLSLHRLLSRPHPVFRCPLLPLLFSHLKQQQRVVFSI